MAATTTYVQEIAAQVAAGRLEALVNGTLFRSIRGLQSKLDLINTPNALESLSRSRPWEPDESNAHQVRRQCLVVCSRAQPSQLRRRCR